MKIYRKYMEYFNKFLMFASVVFLLGVCFFCFAQVFCRFIIKVGLPGTEELTRLCFTWLTCMCSGLCVKEMTNPSISIFRDMLKGKAQMICDILIHVIIIIFGIMFIVLGIPYVKSTLAARFGTLAFSVSWVERQYNLWRIWHYT